MKPIKKVDRKATGVQPTVGPNPRSIAESCQSVKVVLFLGFPEGSNYSFGKMAVHARGYPFGWLLFLT
jgi:hypothetical protein